MRSPFKDLFVYDSVVQVRTLFFLFDGIDVITASSMTRSQLRLPLMRYMVVDGIIATTHCPLDYVVNPRLVLESAAEP